MVRELVPQTNYSELRSWPFLTPSAHPKTVFYQVSRSSLGLKVHLKLTIFLLSGQNVMCTCGFVLQSDWYRAGSQQLFPRMLPGSLLPPILRRDLGTRLGGIKARI